MTLRPLSLPAAPDGAECEVCPQESAMVQIVVYLRPGPCPTLPVSGLRRRKSGPNSRVVPREARGCYKPARHDSNGRLGEYREFRIDGECEARVRCTQGLL